MNTAYQAFKKDSEISFEWPGKRFNTLLTARGVIIIAFLIFLFYSPVLKQTDIVAAVIVYVLSAYVVLLLLITFFTARKIKNASSIRAFQPESLAATGAAIDEQGIATSKIPALFVMQLSKTYVPPGYCLEIQAEFEEGDLALSKHILTGKIGDKHLLKEPVTFPHRGYWKIGRINFILSDKLNLTSYSWSLSENIGNNELVVNPQVSRDSSLPIISSSNRVGDALPDLKEKNGDPFDLKAYHPSDGIRRILWKVYAKSGELISRHPEASMTPEGQVLVYALVGKNDEEVCGAALAYLKFAESLNLEILFSCLGLYKNNVAQTEAEAKELLIDTVWKTQRSDSSHATQSLQSLIDTFNSKASASNIDRIVIFCSKKTLSIQSGVRTVLELADHLEGQGIRPFFCLIESATDNLQQQSSSWFTKLFFKTASSNKERDTKLYYNFLGICKSKNWDFEEEIVQ